MPRSGWLAASGIAAALLLGDASPGFLVVASVAAGAIALAAWARHHVLLVVLAVGAGMVLARMAGGALGAAEPGELPAIPRDERAWEGDLLSLGSVSQGRQTGILRVWPAGATPQEAAASSVRVYARLPRYPALAGGDRIAFSAILQPAPTDPGFGEYLARNHVLATAEVERLTRADAGEGGLGIERLRRAAGESLVRTLPAPEGGLAAGILVGLRDLVDRDLAAAFTASGLSHVVAISGWNIAIVAAVVAALFRRAPARARATAVLATVCLYTIVSGSSPSVVRAAFMGGVAIAARETGRRGQASAALGLAAWILLLVEPTMAQDPGYRLSVAATAGLVGWGTSITAALRRRLPTWSPEWLVETLGVSLAAQAATLPIVLADFGRLSLVAPLANLLVAPFVAPSMLVSLIGLVGGMLVSLGAPGVVGSVAATIGWAGLGPIVLVARSTAALPFASIELQPPFELVAGGLAAMLLVVFGFRSPRRWVFHALRGLRGRRQQVRAAAVESRRPGKPTPGGGNAKGAQGPSRVWKQVCAAVWPASALLRVAWVALAAALLFAVLVAANRPDGRFRLSVLDIGQGDAILLEGGRGGRMLIDTGPDPDRLISLLDERIPPWDRRLDLVLLTHPHEDHVAGLALLLTRYRVGAVAEPGMFGPGPGAAAYRKELAAAGRTTTRLAAGDRLWLDAAQMRVIWPLPGTVPSQPGATGKEINDVSVVVDLRVGMRRMLLMGDVEEEVDPRLLDRGVADEGVPLDVLKVAHHGSRTATTSALLAALRPRVALISVGARNDYGHPSPDTLERLKRIGARVYRTDLDGTITVTTDGRDLEISNNGGRPAPARRTRAPSTAPAGVTGERALADSGWFRRESRSESLPVELLRPVSPVRRGRRSRSLESRRGDPLAARNPRLAARVPTAPLVPRTRFGGGRDRVVSRRAPRGSRAGGGTPSRGISGAAPRHRQAVSRA